MKKPNFFIIGAPKCGTTSLAAWLAEHPQVFFSPVKEPHFFNFDFGGRRFCSLTKYEKLFSEAKYNHIAVGEGSTSYLYSRTAVPAILKYVKNPLFIVLLRNPVDMVYSLHAQQIFNNDETEENFEKAWYLQDIRSYGAQIPNNCLDPQRLFYGDRCMLGKQLSQLLKIINMNQILLLNLDDINNNTRSEYLRALDFLGLADDGRVNFPVLNIAKERRFPVLWRFTKWTNNSLKSMGVPHIRLGLTSFLYQHTKREIHRTPMKQTMRHRLLEYFMDDIKLLEELTGWDLTEWKSVK